MDHMPRGLHDQKETTTLIPIPKQKHDRDILVQTILRQEDQEDLDAIDIILPFLFIGRCFA